MRLPPTRSTPEVDYSLSGGPVLKMFGPCYPMPAEAFFARVMNGDPADPKNVPGLCGILEDYQGERPLKHVFDLYNINSRSEKGPLLDLLDLLHTHSVVIEWLRREDDVSNVRVGCVLVEHWANRCGFQIK